MIGRRPNIWRLLQSSLLIGAALLASGCSPKDKLELGQKVVEQFHRQYNAGQYAAIYGAVDKEFRSTAQLPEFVKYEEGIRAKYGLLQFSEMTNFNVLYAFGKTEVRLDYAAQFERGKAQETFEVSVRGSKAELSGYRLDTPEVAK